MVFDLLNSMYITTFIAVTECGLYLELFCKREEITAWKKLSVEYITAVSVNLYHLCYH